MQLKCNHCGKPVSTEVPDDTVVRASIECPECVERTEDIVFRAGVAAGRPSEPGFRLGPGRRGRIV
jgi:DNA-directed RNA polymerase subunit RPC12/RpoP